MPQGHSIPHAQEQTSLFTEEDLGRSSSRALVPLSVRAYRGPRPLPNSKAGKEYQRLSAKLEALQQEYQDWEQALASLHSQVQPEIATLQGRYAEELLSLLHRVEGLLQEKSLRWGKVQKQHGWEALFYLGMRLLAFPLSAEQRQVLSAFLLRLEALVYATEEPAPAPPDAEIPDAEIFAPGFWESPESPDPFPGAETPDPARAATRAAPEDDASPDWEAFWRAQEAARQQAAQRAQVKARESDFLRGLYRRLISCLHPDRETDPAHRQEKTAQVQVINCAYHEGDLLTLLHCERTLLEPHLSACVWSDQQLREINRILKQQLHRQRQAAEERTAELRRRFGLHPWSPISPRILEQHLRAERESWQTRLTGLQTDQQRIQAEPKAVKPWLQALHREWRQVQKDAAWWDQDPYSWTVDLWR